MRPSRGRDPIKGWCSERPAVLQRCAGNRALFAAAIYLELPACQPFRVGPHSARGAACVNRNMGISGPITTAQDKHLCHELTAVTRIALATRRWLSDRSRSAAVVLGNHPIRVRLHKNRVA
jgi:hypothetical protein